MQLIQRNWNTMDTVTKSINSAYLGFFSTQQQQQQEKYNEKKKKKESRIVDLDVELKRDRVMSFGCFVNSSRDASSIEKRKFSVDVIMITCTYRYRVSSTFKKHRPRYTNCYACIY